jgi:regulator of protease activity HflC (stomatin/prohibitin superfamily)
MAISRSGGGFWKNAIIVFLAVVVIYLAYFWTVRREVVSPGEVLVLIKKNGSRSLPNDQIVIPRPSDLNHDSAAYKQWEKEYGDCNGILEQVYLPGTYFNFSPFDYERIIVKLVETNADIPQGKVGIVIRKFGKPLDPGQVLADESRGQRGPLAKTLTPGTYFEYANPYAYEVKHADAVQIDPGHSGVVTLMAGKAPANPNDYLVEDGELGVQKTTEREGFVYVNPYAKRIKPINTQSQRFEMSGNDEIHFPSNDSFDIKLDGFVEWEIDPAKLPLMYVQYAEGSGLIEFMEQKVILPYARSFCRIIGSQYNARDFISGDTKLKFQKDFQDHLQEACAKQGIIVKQALVRDIVPPEEIKALINEREVAKQQIKSIEQQIIVAKSQAELATQQELGKQNQQIGQANAKVVGVVKGAEQDRDVAVTKANQELAVAKLRLEAAKNEADAVVARGQAEANVVLLTRQAEAEPLRQQVQAFGDGNAYAQYFFYQKIAPSIKSILTTTDGPFADIFRQFTANGAKPEAGKAQKASATDKVTEVQQ